MIKISIPAGCLIKDSNSQALVTQDCLLHTKYIIIRCVLATFKALWKFFSCVLRATLGGGAGRCHRPRAARAPLQMSALTRFLGKNYDNREKQRPFKSNKNWLFFYSCSLFVYFLCQVLGTHTFVSLCSIPYLFVSCVFVFSLLVYYAETFLKDITLTWEDKTNILLFFIIFDIYNKSKQMWLQIVKGPLPNKFFLSPTLLCTYYYHH